MDLQRRHQGFAEPVGAKYPHAAAAFAHGKSRNTRCTRGDQIKVSRERELLDPELTAHSRSVMSVGSSRADADELSEATRR